MSSNVSAILMYGYIWGDEFDTDEDFRKTLENASIPGVRAVWWGDETRWEGGEGALAVDESVVEQKLNLGQTLPVKGEGWDVRLQAALDELELVEPCKPSWFLLGSYG